MTNLMAASMFRACLIVLIVNLGFIFQGCASLEYLDGSSKEETEKFKTTKNEMWNKIRKLKIEKTRSQKQIDILRKENQELARTRDQNELLNEQISKLKERNRLIRDQNQAPANKLNSLLLKHKAHSSESYHVEQDIREMKIKVLTGDGSLNSAKEMARKLRNMGYKIASVDRAPKSDFLRNTVFFAPKFQSEAKRLVSRLGDNTTVKSLSWYSIFDIIIVTGKNL